MEIKWSNLKVEVTKTSDRKFLEINPSRIVVRSGYITMIAKPEKKSIDISK